MMDIYFKRESYKRTCDGCKSEIEEQAPAFELEFGRDKNDDKCETVIILCEDCGNDIQNDMSL